MVAKHCFLLWIFNPFLLFYADFSHRNNQFIHLCPIEGLQFQELIFNRFLTKNRPPQNNLVPGRTGTTRYEVVFRSPVWYPKQRVPCILQFHHSRENVFNHQPQYIAYSVVAEKMLGGVGLFLNI